MHGEIRWRLHACTVRDSSDGGDTLLISGGGTHVVEQLGLLAAALILDAVDILGEIRLVDRLPHWHVHVRE